MTATNTVCPETRDDPRDLALPGTAKAPKVLGGGCR